MLDFSDRTRTGISILTSAADDSLAPCSIFLLITTIIEWREWDVLVNKGDIGNTRSQDFFYSRENTWVYLKPFFCRGQSIARIVQSLQGCYKQKNIHNMTKVLYYIRALPCLSFWQLLSVIEQEAHFYGVIKNDHLRKSASFRFLLK